MWPVSVSFAHCSPEMPHGMRPSSCGRLRCTAGREARGDGRGGAVSDPMCIGGIVTRVKIRALLIVRAIEEELASLRERSEPLKRFEEDRLRLIEVR